MEERVAIDPTTDRPWQGDLCQFFTRDQVARYCLGQVSFPDNLLTVKLLEPAAGHGAFLLPLIPRFVDACRSQKRPFLSLSESIRAYEIDPRVAAVLRNNCASQLREAGVSAAIAGRIARTWVRNSDFLESRIRAKFTHVIGNPPYIRWDAIPVDLRHRYRKRFKSFKQRADLYVAFIEHALRHLEARGQLALLCPGSWTRNTYGGAVREALTSQGRLKSILDLSDVNSFEKSANAYPHFFVFEQGQSGPTHIHKVVDSQKLSRSRKRVERQFSSSSSPLLLSRVGNAVDVIERAKQRFPTLANSGCKVRVGSATGCNPVFVGNGKTLPIEPGRLLPFVNARSIRDARVHWSGTKIVNVFGDHGKLVKLSHYPRLRAYLRKHQVALKNRAKASKSKIWWRTIDALHPAWYRSPKLLVVDISASPVIGLDQKGYCAGSGVYQIKSEEWPLRDLLVLLSAGVLGLFVAGCSTGSETAFHRFQKAQISAVPIPRWSDLDPAWLKRFQHAIHERNADAILSAVSVLYECEKNVLGAFVARDWKSLAQGKWP